MPDLRDEFEAKYQRSADDPASAEMLAIWEAAWNTATERAAKKEREDTERMDALEAVTVENQWIVARQLDSFTAYFGRGKHATRRTLREAIDAAIRAREGKGAKG